MIVEYLHFVKGFSGQGNLFTPAARLPFRSSLLAFFIIVSRSIQMTSNLFVFWWPCCLLLLFFLWPLSDPHEVTNNEFVIDIYRTSIITECFELVFTSHRYFKESSPPNREIVPRNVIHGCLPTPIKVNPYVFLLHWIP